MISFVSQIKRDMIDFRFQTILDIAQHNSHCPGREKGSWMRTPLMQWENSTYWQDGYTSHVASGLSIRAGYGHELGITYNTCHVSKVYLATSLAIKGSMCVVLIVNQSTVISVIQVVANLSIPGTGPTVVQMNIVIYIPILGIPKFKLITITTIIAHKRLRQDKLYGSMHSSALYS